jgi:ligand-binding sensor domain-containing protein
LRWQLSHWGENDGLDSETCHDLELGADGTVWAATAKGAVRFDGKLWRRFGSKDRGPTGSATDGKVGTATRWPVDRDGDPAVAAALVLSGQTLWAGTPRGLWPLSDAGSPVEAGTGLLDDDIRKLTSDRFGRIWALGRIGVTIRRPLGR